MLYIKVRNIGMEKRQLSSYSSCSFSVIEKYSGEKFMWVHSNKYNFLQLSETFTEQTYDLFFLFLTFHFFLQSHTHTLTSMSTKHFCSMPSSSDAYLLCVCLFFYRNILPWTVTPWGHELYLFLSSSLCLEKFLGYWRFCI